MSDLLNVRAALVTLAEFAKTAPGRLPCRVQAALSVADEDPMPTTEAEERMNHHYELRATGGPDHDEVTRREAASTR